MGIMALQAEWERERMSTRRLEEISATKLAGFYYTSLPPIGFSTKVAQRIGTRDYRVLVPNVAEQVTLERCYHWCAELGIDLDTIGRHMNKGNVPHLRKMSISDEGKRLWNHTLIRGYVADWEALMDTESNVLALMTPEEVDAARRKQSEYLVIDPPDRSHRRNPARKNAARLRYLARQNLDQFTAGGANADLIAIAEGLAGTL